MISKHTLLFKLGLAILCLASGCDRPTKIATYKDLEYSSYGTKLDLFLPQQKSSQPLPVLIYIHGGGWWGGDKNLCLKNIQKRQGIDKFINRGYALACINYRLSDRAIFPAQIQDVKTAVRWLKQNANKYNLNPDKIGAWGESAGGHLSALLATSAGVKELEVNLKNPQISTRIQAAVNLFGPTDFTKVPPAFEEPYTPAVQKYKDRPWYHYTVATNRLLGGPVSKNLKLATLANPITHLDPKDPPFLIAHGALDDTVPLSQSELLVKALQAKGIEVTFIQEPKGTHYFGGDKGEYFAPKYIDMMLKFFDTHLKDK
ncbi:alpha/beta hydrolase fold domain-containing protein [Microseira sp. BLCC-F43]|jgi:acetyl esterase/lipase|uniref:alpha/beta hydrolase fold domain-containing protein n=1 Tax=Microseira sp. BLCC-F43 TaxID=3153602 RepID=UPI0035B8A684